ncbi:Bacillolysin [Bacillus sp. GeD10]|nr:Bacillolysin [Bacillus sp. GeD10]
MNYRKLASAFVTFGLLCPLSTEAIHAQELEGVAKLINIQK